MLVTSRYQASVRALACLMLSLVTDTRADAAAEVLARADAFLNNNTISQGFKVSINILRYNLGQLILLMPSFFLWLFWKSLHTFAHCRPYKLCVKKTIIHNVETNFIIYLPTYLYNYFCCILLDTWSYLLFALIVNY